MSSERNTLQGVITLHEASVRLCDCTIKQHHRHVKDKRLNKVLLCYSDIARV